VHSLANQPGDSEHIRISGRGRRHERPEGEPGPSAWACTTCEQLAINQAQHPVASKAVQAVEGVINKVKDALS
jgi:hypothetical protein